MCGKILSIDSFGEILLKRREALGYTQEELARLLLIHDIDTEALTQDEADALEDKVHGKRKAIGRWESGQSEPLASDFKRLCEILNCDPEYLWGICPTPRRDTRDLVELTGLTVLASEVLCSLKVRAEESQIVAKIVDTLSRLLENVDERKPWPLVEPTLAYISAYLNCAPDDDRIVSIEMDGSVLVYDDWNAFESEPGEALSGDYMRQIVKTRLEQRVMDSLRSLWDDVNKESKEEHLQRILSNSKNKPRQNRDRHLKAAQNSAR